MHKGFLKHENSSVHFQRFGKGDRLLVAIHGFADDEAIFLKLEESLKEVYTVYCIDLPFHGSTQWDKEEFDQKDISTIFKMILQKEKKERFELMGFSLGGRIVLKMLGEWIPQLDKVYLIAPDGLKTKWLSPVNLVPRWLKSFLKWLLRNPEWLINMAKAFHRWGLVSRFIYHFVYFHFQTKEKSDRLFHTWCSLGYFKINPRNVKTLLKKHPIPVEMYFGTCDEIIPLSAAIPLSEGMPNITIHKIEEGHFLVGHKLNGLLKAQLK